MQTTGAKVRKWRRSGTDHVRTKLLLAAEQLFIQNGIGGTSLREIAARADNGNTNAVKYHFGAKEDLVRALFAFRVQQMEPGRLARLESLERERRLGDLKALLEVICLPYLDIVSDDGRFSYLELMSNYLTSSDELLWSHPTGYVETVENGLDKLAELAWDGAASTDERANSAILRTWGLIRRRLFYLPDEIFRSRFALSHLMFSNAVVRWQRDRNADKEALRVILDDTFEMMVAGLALPFRGGGRDHASAAWPKG